MGILQYYLPATLDACHHVRLNRVRVSKVEQSQATAALVNTVPALRVNVMVVIMSLSSLFPFSLQDSLNTGWSLGLV